MPNVISRKPRDSLRSDKRLRMVQKQKPMQAMEMTLEDVYGAFEKCESKKELLETGKDTEITHAINLFSREDKDKLRADFRQKLEALP